MPTLRQCLKRPETYLLGLLLLLVLVALDSLRIPANQVTARFYIGGVRIYQAIGRPLLKGYVQCRYYPTCSDYSIEAVRTHGTRYGIILTFKRINSCQSNVPMGTLNSVPPIH
ncbi:MAG TPA: membrane protein insertion efficiency factor YidD [Blastocatellia bacterium]|nr:membrane protein insertion efficiency factor YidD [Blastocatellia bacterium]